MRYKLNERLREELKKPLGRKTETFEEPFIAVGDICLSNALSNNKKPLLGIYDNLVERGPSTGKTRETIRDWNAEKVVLDNPPGTINEKAIGEIQKAIENKTMTKLEIRGEEDLLVIPCLLHAPEGTNVYYGQPGEGMILVEADQKSKKKAEKILEEMRQ